MNPDVSTPKVMESADFADDADFPSAPLPLGVFALKIL